MKKKLKKSLACLLATLLIFSTVPMSALADEAAAPVTVETVVEEAAPDTEPDAEPTATPEASAKPSAEPTAEPSPEATEEPTESEVSAEPEATAEPTASPTPNPEDEISLLALGDEAVTRYRTVGINGNFSSNYLYDLGQYPLYDILLNGTSYPAYCLQHGKGRVNNYRLFCKIYRRSSVCSRTTGSPCPACAMRYYISAATSRAHTNGFPKRWDRKRSITVATVQRIVGRAAATAPMSKTVAAL